MTFCLRKVTKLKENKGKNISKRNVRTTEKVECLIMNNFSLWKKARKKDVCSGKRKKKVGASNSMRTMSPEIKSILPKWISFSTKWIPFLALEKAKANNL